MRGVRIVLAVVVVGAGLVFGVETRADTKAAEKMVVEGNSEFGWGLYERLREKEGNMFFSPYSISTALAMTYGGAEGETASQMAEAMRFASEDGCTKVKMLSREEFHKAFGRIIEGLNERGGAEKYELAVANALWGQKGYKFLEEYLSLVEENYQGKLSEVDFAQATEEARQRINEWVEAKTREKIKELIKPGMLDRMTRLVLTNAIYFKGKWASEFDEELTSRQPFSLVSGEKVQTPMMHQREEFGYMEGDGFQGLEMPYVGEELSMVVFLPSQVGEIRELEGKLSAENVSRWVGQMRKREVDVWFPRFEMTSEFELGRVLQAMGMRDAFSGDADFSGMTGGRELYISAVVHKAYVKVDEEGTEAAAATGVVMRVTAVAEVPVFRADRPFVFVIRDRVSGSILFVGRVMNPTA